jgi:hypothetical protein
MTEYIPPERAKQTKMGGPDFDGPTYDADLDKHRFSTQLATVLKILLLGVGDWHTPMEVRERAGLKAETAAISARIRDLRKTKFGDYVIACRRRVPRKSGIYEYRLVQPTEPEYDRYLKEKEKARGDRSFLRACSHCGKKHHCSEAIQPDLPDVNP